MSNKPIDLTDLEWENYISKPRNKRPKRKLRISKEKKLLVIKGGPGSGFHGHSGIPGHQGGSQAEPSAKLQLPKFLKSSSVIASWLELNLHIDKMDFPPEMSFTKAKKLANQILKVYNMTNPEGWKGLKIWAFPSDKIDSSGKTVAQYNPYYNYIQYNPDRVPDQVDNAFNVATGFWSTDEVIIHEIGHALHHNEQSVAYDQLAQTYQGRGLNTYEWRNTMDIINPHLPYEYKQPEIARKVSLYASYHPVEFVAETFAGLVDGKTYDEDIMTLYKYLYGPKVRGMK